VYIPGKESSMPGLRTGSVHLGMYVNGAMERIQTVVTHFISVKSSLASSSTVFPCSNSAYFFSMSWGSCRSRNPSSACLNEHMQEKTIFLSSCQTSTLLTQ